MAIPEILYTTLTNYSISASKNTATTSNLLNYFTDSLWISTTSSDQSLFITFNTDKACDSFVLDPFDTNLFGNNAKLTISAADTANFSSGLQTPVNNFSLSATNINDVLLIKFSEISKRFWKINLSSMNVSPSAGNIWIDKTLVFQTSYDFGYKKEDSQYNTTEFIALDGTERSSQNYSGKLIYEIKFSLQNDTIRSNYQTFMQSIRGKLRPFYLLDENVTYTSSAGVNYYTGGNVRYMKLDSDYSPLTVRHYGQNDTETLRLKSKYANF